MRVKVWMGFVAVVAAAALAGCGNRNVIGSTPPPTPSPSPPSVTNEFAVTSALGEPTDIAEGNDGLLYSTLFNTNDVTAYTITTNTFTLYAAKERPAGPTGITLGPDNDIWFTEPLADHIATISLGAVKEFAATPGAAPGFISSGPNETLYFTEPGLNSIGSISAATDIVAGPYAIPTANAGPLGITIAPDNNIWFCEHNAAKIARLNTITNKVDMELALPAGSTNPTDIVIGPDGALWFTENNPAGPQLGRLALSNFSFTEYSLIGAKSATGLAVALNNNFYFTDPTNNAIGAFDLQTVTSTEYPIPTANANPTAIALGPDGKLYFTEQKANKIGQFSYF